MNVYKNTDEDIHKRIFIFVTQCFNEIVKKIPKTTENIPIIQQISASLTSIGANDNEADAAGSSRDFIAKYVIVRKETKETIYWLSFVQHTNHMDTSIIEKFINEGNEIKSIISKIIENTKKHVQY